MNYIKIHDELINRAKSRKYDNNIYHKHHIIPLHEDPDSSATIPLTFKEHYLVHLLRYKMGYGQGNLLAYVWLRGINSSSYDNMWSWAGKRGGKSTKERESGIFSPSWDRSSETSRRWRDGIMPEPYLKQNPHIASQNIQKLMETKMGIFSPFWDRSIASKLLWETRPQEERQRVLSILKVAGKIGNQKSKELGLNFSGWDKERHKEVAGQGGRIVGKIPMWTNGEINKRSYVCPGDGFRRGVTLKHKITKEKIISYKEIE